MPCDRGASIRRVKLSRLVVLALVGCGGAEVIPASPIESVHIDARTRSMSILVIEGSCWGSDVVAREVVVGDDLAVVREGGTRRVLSLDEWSTKRAAIERALSSAREYDGRCRGGANYECSAAIALDDGRATAVCCGPNARALVDAVRAL
jgi:hypothetical protein